MIRLLGRHIAHLVRTGHDWNLHAGKGIWRLHVTTVVVITGVVLLTILSLAVVEGVVRSLHTAAQVWHGLEHGVGWVPDVAAVSSLLVDS